MVSQTLFEIGEDLTALSDILTEVDGDVTDVEKIMDDWFAEIHGSMDQKIDGYAALIQEFTVRSKVRKEEAKRLTDRAKIDENAAERLKARLKLFFDMHNMRKLETPRFKITIAKNGGVLPLETDIDPDIMPEEFQKVTISEDNGAIRKYLETKKLKWARLGGRGESLRIK